MTDKALGTGLASNIVMTVMVQAMTTVSLGNSMVPLSNAVGYAKTQWWGGLNPAPSNTVLLNIQENIPLAIFSFYPLFTYNHIIPWSERHFGICKGAVRKKTQNA